MKLKSLRRKEFKPALIVSLLALSFGALLVNDGFKYSEVSPRYELRLTDTSADFKSEKSEIAKEFTIIYIDSKNEILEVSKDADFNTLNEKFSGKFQILKLNGSESKYLFINIALSLLVLTLSTFLISYYVILRKHLKLEFKNILSIYLKTYALWIALAEVISLGFLSIVSIFYRLTVFEINLTLISFIYLTFILIFVIDKLKNESIDDKLIEQSITEILANSRKTLVPFGLFMIPLFLSMGPRFIAISLNILFVYMVSLFSVYATLPILGMDFPKKSSKRKK